MNSAMQNKAMERKLQDGSAIDLKNCKREPANGTVEGNNKNPYYIIEQQWDTIEEHDFCDSSIENWIWSIGMRLSDGVILASTTSDLYQNELFECLWLR